MVCKRGWLLGGPQIHSWRPRVGSLERLSFIYQALEGWARYIRAVREFDAEPALLTFVRGLL